MAGEFSTGICACFDDMEICCYSFFTGPLGKASAYSKATGNDWCQACVLAALFPHIMECYFRTQVREAYGYDGNCCLDCLTAYFCGPCSTAQMWREFAAKGPGTQAMK
jgi:Cys-rich protein (TIGR01571 family)